MSDITMCQDIECPLRVGCYRFTATPNDFWQSYFAETPRKEDGSCDEYWKNEVAPSVGIA